MIHSTMNLRQAKMTPAEREFVDHYKRLNRHVRIEDGAAIMSRDWCGDERVEDFMPNWYTVRESQLIALYWMGRGAWRTAECYLDKMAWTHFHCYLWDDDGISFDEYWVRETPEGILAALDAEGKQHGEYVASYED